MYKYIGKQVSIRNMCGEYKLLSYSRFNEKFQFVVEKDNQRLVLSRIQSNVKPIVEHDEWDISI